MDGKKHHQSQKKYKFLKRTVQFVISLSVFSFSVWYSSGFSILPQSFNAYFSTFLFSMLTRTLERKYMFLICNAILALLAKSSVLASSSPPMSPFDLEFQVSTNTKAQVSDVAVFPVGSFRCLENAPLIAEEETGQVKKQEECYGQVLEAEGEEHGTGTLFVGGMEDADEEGGTRNGVMVRHDDELADTTLMAANEELASTDELNRKFEEFIKKMKEEMRIEAQRQAIVF